ncbi:hypothetical protein GCM10011360_18250 [Primorskyibacter flagellatus]|uniref:Uncharacterized protein n=1 Tax=Primorskyibacter flagellatus TaxID=1387277 RepID=A0A917EEU0_9RHOB|nr:hypothetical protein GCM10011360_18250 [Primorskyibacter flagellatus]
MAALEAGDDIGALGEPVDDLSLPLVAPLGSDDNDIGHVLPSGSCPNRALLAKARQDRNRNLLLHVPLRRQSALDREGAERAKVPPATDRSITWVSSSAG